MGQGGMVSLCYITQWDSQNLVLHHRNTDLLWEKGVAERGAAWRNIWLHASSTGKTGARSPMPQAGCSGLQDAANGGLVPAGL